MNAFEPAVRLPSPGRIVVESRILFGDPDSVLCQRFVARATAVEAVTAVTVRPGSRARAELRYRVGPAGPEETVERIAAALRRDPTPDERACGPALPPPSAARDSGGVARYYRYGARVTAWRVTSDRPGRLRLRNRALAGHTRGCRALEKELSGVPGILGCRASALTSVVRVEYDGSRLTPFQVLDALDRSLATGAGRGPASRRAGVPLAARSALVPLAAVAEFAVPPLVPVAAVLVACTALPALRAATRRLVRERRLGVDAVDAAVLAGCLGTMSVFPAALLCWCADVSRPLARRGLARAWRVLVDDLETGPCRARLYHEGHEYEVPRDRVRPGHVVVVRAGEPIPVDGHVVEGVALVDSAALTAAPSASEKGVGEPVFASTAVLAGTLYVSASACGPETAVERLRGYLTRAAGGGEHVADGEESTADRGVIPALAAGGLAAAVAGFAGGLAVLKSHPGAGTRAAAPYALLGALARCASEGIVVTDARALARMRDVDTVLLDASVIRSAQSLEVGPVAAAPGRGRDDVLGLAAAALGRFHQPAARALRREAGRLGLNLSEADDVQYRVGQGVSARVDGRTVRVGTDRFVAAAGVTVPAAALDAARGSRRGARAQLFVSADDEFCGAFGLTGAVWPEAREMIAGLRRRGIRDVRLVSGDDAAATAELAESLGLDRWHASLDAEGKAAHLRRLRAAGHRVCFVGDGTDDADALRAAAVSVSTRGLTAAPPEAAGVLLLGDDLGKLCVLHDASREMKRQLERSWRFALVPGLACTAGAFTLGFGVTTAIVASQVGALLAASGAALSLRDVARARAERRYGTELRRRVAVDGPVG